MNIIAAPVIQPSITHQHPVLASLQLLLQPDVDPSSSGGDVQQGAAIFAQKVSTSLTILTSTPSLHPLALEVVSNALVYQLTHSLPFHSEGEESLSGQLGLVWKFLDLVLTHCPKGWATVLYKWCVKLLGRVTQVQRSPSSVEEALQTWLSHPVLAPVLSFLNRCTGLLVESDQVGYCMDTLFPVSATHAPNLSWLLAHIVSQYPSQMMSVLLDHTLSFPYLPSLAPPQSTPPHSFTALTQALIYLSRTHRDHLKQATVDSLTRILSGGSGGVATADSVRMLLVVATHCPPLAQFIAMDCFDFIDSAKIRKLMMNKGKATPTEESHDNQVTKKDSEEDEGEILSDEEEMDTDQKSEGPSAVRLEEMIGLVCGLLSQLRGREAVRALSCVMDIYLQTATFIKTEEEPVEEGEIVHESPLESVVDACRRIMSDFLSRLHSSTCLTHLTPQKGSAGGDVDLVMSLGCGLVEWADQLLAHFREESSDHDICITWLHEVITCVCICSSELVAGRLLAHLLLTAHSQAQLTQVLEIYWEVHIRHPHLADSAVGAAISSLQRVCHAHSNKPDSAHTNSDVSGGCEANEMMCFIKNMLTVLSQTGSGSVRQQNTRLAFLSVLSDQVLIIAHLLPDTLTSHSHPQFLLMLDLFHCILIGQSKSPTTEISCQIRCEITSILLSSFFHLLKTSTKSIIEGGQTELVVELCLVRCRDLIGWCSNTQIKDHSPSVQTLAYTTIMESVLSEEMSSYFSKPKLAQAQIVRSAHSPSTHPHLLSDASSLQPGMLYRLKFNSRELKHSGKLSSRQTGSNHRNDEDHVEVAIITNTSHLIQLLLVVTCPDPSKTDQGLASKATTPNIPGLSMPEQVVCGLECLAHLLMDRVAPINPVRPQQWPEEDSLKYSLERDLTIKCTFDENPILWHLLLLFSEQNGHSPPLLVCASLVCSLLTVLSQHWQRCRLDDVSRFPLELESSMLLVECLAKANWIPAPLSFIGELFPFVSSKEVHLLVAALQTFLKENFKQILSHAFGSNFKDTGYMEVIKSTLLNNISRLGHVYPRYMKHISSSEQTNTEN